MEPVNLVEDETAQPSKNDAASGRFFIVNLKSMEKLFTAEPTLEEICGYLCLAAASDRSNTVSKAGKLGIKRLLGIQDRAAEHILAGLSQKGAIVALEGARRRGPGLARYHLMPIGVTDPTRAGDAGTYPVGQPAAAAVTTPDPHFNILIPNTFVRPAGASSSPVQLIQRYGDIATLWTALRCFHVDSPLLFACPSAAPRNDHPRLGPLVLISFPQPKFNDLDANPRTDDFELSLNVAGQLSLGISAVRLHLQRVGPGGSTSAPLPLASIRDGRLERSGPTAGLSLLAFWLGHPEVCECRDVEVAEKIIEMWLCSETQFAAVPATAIDGQVWASLHFDSAAETPRGREDQKIYVEGCQRALVDLCGLIDRLTPDRSTLAEELLWRVEVPFCISKGKR